MKLKNYYQILGIDPFVSDGEIKRAYHTKLMEYRPDKIYGHNTFEFKRFQAVMEAYEAIKTPEKRAAYDQLLKIEISSKKNGTQNTPPANNNRLPKPQKSFFQWLFSPFKMEQKG